MKSYFVEFGSRLISMSRAQKQLVMFLVDLLILESSLYIALLLTTNNLSQSLNIFLQYFLLPLLIGPILFVCFGLYNSIIRYAGIFAFNNIIKATITYAFILGLWFDLPEWSCLSFTLIHGLLVLNGLGASRATARRWLSHAQNHNVAHSVRKRAIIFGAGSAGVQLSLALSQSREINPIAFIDDDEKLHRKNIAGLTVYSRNELEDLIFSHRISEVLLALPSISRGERNNIISQLEKLPIQVRTLPSVSHLAEGKVKTSDLREVDIEDLLGRDPVPPKISLLEENIRDKAVLVTGAGGSIGSELCRQILMYQPKLLVLYELNEFALFNIEQELIKHQPTEQQNKLFPILGSVTDPVRFDLVLKFFKIQTVYHSAAYKHVPMVEKNPCAGVYNNVLGTWYAAKAAQKNNVNTFVLISTDKAVRPSNTMGTSKRLAELVLQALNQVIENRTRFIMVRFGNVLGSSGSVLPVFKDQIKNGGPITVTDPRIIRYFMTITEAAQLVIQASAMGQGGDVFVLDMGEPVKIFELARKLIRLSGLSVRDDLNPSGDIEISFSGLRPGEKLYEELLIGNNVSPTEHSRILRANEQMLPYSTIERLCKELEKACLVNDSIALRSILLNTVKEFVPQCGNEDLLAQ